MPWTELESRRKHYDKYLKSSKLEDCKKQGVTLICKICGHKFHPRKDQHPKYTLYCDECRKTGVVRDATIYERV